MGHGVSFEYYHTMCLMSVREAKAHPVNVTLVFVIVVTVGSMQCTIVHTVYLWTPYDTESEYLLKAL